MLMATCAYQMIRISSVSYNVPSPTLKYPDQHPGNPRKRRKINRCVGHAVEPRKGFITKTAEEKDKLHSTRVDRAGTASARKSRASDPSLEVLDFLKSRPQVKAMQDSQNNFMALKTPPSAPRAHNDPAQNAVVGDGNIDPSSWQHSSESILEFLKRAPVAEPRTAQLGPWLWVRTPGKRTNQVPKVSAFIEGGNGLLANFRNHRIQMEQSSPGQAVETITRNLRPSREQLEVDILALAVSTGVTSGKWMFFPQPEKLSETWRIVAEATSQGKLGPTSKVATWEPPPSRPERVICVYTYNFTDIDDIKRVLQELVNLRLVVEGEKPIYYKCDAYTYLDLMSGNEYKIQASLFSSNEMIRNSASVKPDGPVARLKKMMDVTNGL